MRVLVMDDDVDLLHLMQLKLGKQGFDVTTSLCGSHFLDHLITEKPSIILLDIQMPGLEGSSICKLLKASTETASIPILMFSASEDIESISNYCGADGFIRKPFNIDVFTDRIRDLLANASVTESARIS